MLICLTALAITALVAYVVQDLIKDARSTRIAVAEKERAAVSATGELVAAIEAIRLVANRLAPAPTRVGRPVTIHTRDGQVLTGLVLEEFADRTRIGDAHFVTADGKHPVPGGTASVLKANESWRQEHDA